MNRFSLKSLFVTLLMASAAFAQQAPENTPPADIPNSQQNPYKAKRNAPKKIYTNADLASPEAKPETAKKTDENNGAANPVADGDSAKADRFLTPVLTASPTPAEQTPNSCESASSPASNTSRLPVLDAPKQNLPDVIVVPAGTQIKVDISEENPPLNVPQRTFSGKVTIPVRVGWDTVIPALTKVTVEVSALYYSVAGRYDNAGFQGFAQLTSVMLDGKRYDLQTDQVPVLAGSATEATFTLLDDVTLNR